MDLGAEGGVGIQGVTSRIQLQEWGLFGREGGMGYIRGKKEVNGLYKREERG